MKLSKNILILLGSYLGAVALVACVAQLASPRPSGGASEGVDVTDRLDLPVDLPVSDTADLPAAVTKEEGTEPKDEATNLPTDGGAESDAERVVYCIRTVNDGASVSIGIYGADGTLIDVLDTPVWALPASDRARLEAGIEVSGEEALAQLLEDFGG